MSHRFRLRFGFVKPRVVVELELLAARELAGRTF